MSGIKSNKEAAISMALSGMMPLIITELRGTDEYKAITEGIRELRIAVRDMRAKSRGSVSEIAERAVNTVADVVDQAVRRADEVDGVIEEKLQALEQRVAEFLTEHNLERVLEDVRIEEPEANALKAREPGSRE